MSDSGINSGFDWPQLYREQALVCKDERLQLFYGSGCPAPDTPLSDVPFVALDFETTGLDAGVDEIVSIGLVPFDIRRIRPREAKQWLLNPQQELREESVVIHGITHSEINNAPDLDAVLGELLGALAGRVVVAHYRYIEREFLDANIRRRIGEGVQFPIVDTMELEAMQYRKRWSMLRDKLLGRKQTSIRLGDSRTRYGLPHYSSHDAVVDSIATAELLQAQIRHRFSEDTPIKDLWI